MSETNISRRSVVKNAALLAVTGAVASGAAMLTGCGTPKNGGSGQAASGTSVDKIKWDEDVDVLVIGSGFTGVAAAIAAREQNPDLNVVLIEKMARPGGNSIICGNAFAAVGSDAQKQDGVEDSVDLCVKDMLEAGLYLNNVDKCKTIAEKSWETMQWTETWGVEWNPTLIQFNGHSVKRSMQPNNGIVVPGLARLKELGVEPRCNTFLERFVVDEANNRILGASIYEDYQFNESKPWEPGGTHKMIRARYGVVLASGGFSRDLVMRQNQMPQLTSDFDSTNHPGATAETLDAAFRVGANSIQIDQIQLLPETSPDEKGFGNVPKMLYTMPYGVQLNPTTGKRFMNELADRKRKADAIIATGEPCVLIIDSSSLKGDLDWRQAKWFQNGLEAGTIKEIPTLEEVFKTYGINAEGAAAEIEHYNDMVRKGEDTDFGRPIREDCQPLGTEPPFYCARFWPKVHHCMGGIDTDHESRVLHYDTPITGFYAAGECTGGTHGACRLGSCAVADCIIFGKIAGENVVKESPWF